jgi:hypothetical protein
MEDFPTIKNLNRRVPAETGAEKIQECQNNMSSQRDSQSKNEGAPQA